MVSRCDSRLASLDLESFAFAVDPQADALAGSRTGSPGRADLAELRQVVTGECASEAYIAEMIIWETRDAELVAARKADGRNFNKHRDLAS